MLNQIQIQPDEIAPFLIPSLGRPYLDQWQEDDEATYAAFRSPLPSESSPPPTSSRNTTNFALQPPPLERFRPEDVNDDSSKTENVYVGPLTERLVAALALNGFSGGGGGAGGGPLALGPKETEEPAAETLLYSSGAGAVDAVELEDRVKRELRFIGVLGDEEVRLRDLTSSMPVPVSDSVLRPLLPFRWSGPQGRTTTFHRR